MTVRASGNIPLSVPLEAYRELRAGSFNLKQFLITRVAEFGTGGDAQSLFNTIDGLRNSKRQFNLLKTTQGLKAVARFLENDDRYDIVVEFDALNPHIDKAMVEINAILPVDTSGFLSSHIKNADGTRSPRPFNAASLVNLVSDLNAVIAEIA